MSCHDLNGMINNILSTIAFQALGSNISAWLAMFVSTHLGRRYFP